jgi:H+-transporting ATPase
LALKAVVLRDGTLKEVEAPEVVPGDILQVEEGTIIPADGRFVTEGCFVQVDQSAITGESLAVDKHAGDNCYASSAVKRGEAFVIVTATGDNTFVGRAAALVSQSAGGTGHFTEVLNGIGTILLVLYDLPNPNYSKTELTSSGSSLLCLSFGCRPFTGPMGSWTSFGSL